MERDGHLRSSARWQLPAGSVSNHQKRAGDVANTNDMVLLRTSQHRVLVTLRHCAGLLAAVTRRNQPAHSLRCTPAHCMPALLHRICRSVFSSSLPSPHPHALARWTGLLAVQQWHVLSPPTWPTAQHQQADVLHFAAAAALAALNIVAALVPLQVWIYVPNLSSDNEKGPQPAVTSGLNINNTDDEDERTPLVQQQQQQHTTAEDAYRRISDYRSVRSLSAKSAEDTSETPALFLCIHASLFLLLISVPF